LSFEEDLKFSEECDLKLSKFWKQKSFEGRFVFTRSLFLQKIHGIDVILQGKDNTTELKIDTKHVRSIYTNLFLEEMSCTIQGHEKLGWILKEDGHPDFIAYCMWFNNDNSCYIYMIPFTPLRDWFIQNKEKYRLFINNTVNKTSGRIVPLEDIKLFVGYDKYILNLSNTYEY